MIRLNVRALGPLALALALLSGQARAGVILQPASASTNMGTFDGSPDDTRNQSGLSAGYTSGVTDFDAYVASNPTHASNDFANDWISAGGFPTGNFDFALGGTFTIQSFALWNIGGNEDFNLRGFELLASDDASFSTFTSLGTFDANPNTGPDTAVLPEVFPFAPTSAAFVRMRITSNNGSIFSTGFGEAAFEVQSSPTAIPEPGTLALLASGVLSAGLWGWRRRRAASA